MFSYIAPNSATAAGLPEPYPLSCSPWYHTTPRAASPARGAALAFQCCTGTILFEYGVNSSGLESLLQFIGGFGLPSSFAFLHSASYSARFFLYVSSFFL